MKSFSGHVLFLDRSDINTDEIIPARYLTEIKKSAVGPHLLEDLNLEGFDPKRDIVGKSVIVTRDNFGCGSSREHAPWALEANGVHLVIARSFARIFRQNMYNCGMMALELGQDHIEMLFQDFQGADTVISADVKAGKLRVSSSENPTAIRQITIEFNLSGFDEKLVETGGWVEYADQHY